MLSFTIMCPLILQITTSASLALESLILWTFTLISDQGSPIFSFEHLWFFSFKHWFRLHWLHCSVAVYLLHISDGWEYPATPTASLIIFDLHHCLLPSSLFMFPSGRQLSSLFMCLRFFSCSLIYSSTMWNHCSSQAAFFSRSQLHEELHYGWLHLILLILFSFLLLHLDRSPHQYPETPFLLLAHLLLLLFCSFF